MKSNPKKHPILTPPPGAGGLCTEGLDILELFSGIGGFTKGFIDAGYSIRNHYFSEIDTHAIANYKYNFPHAQYLGSVTTISAGTIPSPHVVTFGSPCQDFSISGKRAGMDGQRSSLISEAIRIVTDLRPAVFIWENVKGTFSSNNGSDFWAIIAAFANIGGYRLQWQLLNTSWFLPQNRERIYLVGLASEGGFRELFPITENDRLPNLKTEPNPRQSQANNARTLTKGQLRADDNYVKVPTIAGALCGGGNSGGLHSQMTTIEVGTLRTHKDGAGFRNTESQLCPTIPARAREDGSGQPIIKVTSNTLSDQYEEVSPTGGKGAIIVNSNTQKGYETAEVGDSINYSNPNTKTRRGRVGKNIANTLDTQGQQAVAVSTIGRKTKDQNGSRFKEDECFTLCSQEQHGVQLGTRIRRLTEIENERLQGFPDDWTRYGMYEKKVWINKKLKTFEIVEGLKEIPATARYKMCGNAVTVDVVAAIARKLRDTP